MATVFLVHWNESEAEERAARLRAAGHDVRAHWSEATGPALAPDLPEIVVVSLDRLPSHGRAVAEWVWEAKKRRHIPIVFSGGEKEKVIAARERFPGAVFCSTGAIVSTVGKLARRVSPGDAPSPAKKGRPARG